MRSFGARTFLLSLALTLLAGGGARSSAQTAGPDDLGRIDFPVSTGPEAQARFVRGVKWLHSFGYEDAAEEFEEAIRLEPGFAMGYWGLAMCHTQPVWATENLEAGRAALARLGATPAERGARAPTPRERDYLAAIEIVYGPGDKPSRDQAFAEAMGRLAARYPDDDEAAVFHALALLGTMSRGDRPDLDELPDAHAHMLAGSETQEQAAAILERVLAANPDHPGAAHYLIHAYDDPQHAARALPAARMYARIAMASSHAHHMPAHIFLQLGMWSEAAASDERSYQVSDERVRQRGLSIAQRDYHSLSWLQYEYLQLGRYRDAWKAREEIQPAVDRTGEPRLKNALASMTARYAVETRRWTEFAAKPDYFNLDELFAIGMSAARTGDLARAGTTRERLEAIATSDRIRQLKPIATIMERQMAGLFELGSGRRDSAVAALTEAAALEDRMAPPVGRPHPLKPSHELLGDVLLEVGRPREAADHFTRALRRSPNRSLSVLGLARARAAMGDVGSAREQYQQLLANWSGADADLPEIAEARAAVAGSSDFGALARPAGTAFPRTIWMVSGAGAAAALGWTLWRRRHRRPDRPAPPSGARDRGARPARKPARR